MGDGLFIVKGRSSVRHSGFSALPPSVIRSRAASFSAASSNSESRARRIMSSDVASCAPMCVGGSSYLGAVLRPAGCFSRMACRSCFGCFSLWYGLNAGASRRILFGVGVGLVFIRVCASLCGSSSFFGFLMSFEVGPAIRLFSGRAWSRSRGRPRPCLCSGASFRRCL